jgi:hypothetical protein
MELDERGESDLGARMVNAARMAVAVHVYESVRERLRRPEDGSIGMPNPEGQDGLPRDSRQDDDDSDSDDSLWQRPRTGGAGFRVAGIDDDDDDDGRPAIVIASARRATLVTDDDEGGEDGTAGTPATAADEPAPARSLPTAAARSPRAPRLPAAGGAPPHIGGALPRPGVAGTGRGSTSDQVVTGSITCIRWAEGAD